MYVCWMIVLYVTLCVECWNCLWLRTITWHMFEVRLFGGPRKPRTSSPITWCSNTLTIHGHSLLWIIVRSCPSLFVIISCLRIHVVLYYGVSVLLYVVSRCLGTVFCRIADVSVICLSFRQPASSESAFACYVLFILHLVSNSYHLGLRIHR